eukprot:1368839-Pleurochrysis_carterae.AAC.3
MATAYRQPAAHCSLQPRPQPRTETSTRICRRSFRCDLLGKASAAAHCPVQICDARSKHAYLLAVSDKQVRRKQLPSTSFNGASLTCSSTKRRRRVPRWGSHDSRGSRAAVCKIVGTQGTDSSHASTQRGREERP